MSDKHKIEKFFSDQLSHTNASPPVGSKEAIASRLKSEGLLKDNGSNRFAIWGLSIALVLLISGGYFYLNNNAKDQLASTESPLVINNQNQTANNSNNHSQKSNTENLTASTDQQIPNSVVRNLKSNSNLPVQQNNSTNATVDRSERIPNSSQNNIASNNSSSIVNPNDANHSSVTNSNNQIQASPNNSSSPAKSITNGERYETNSPSISTAAHSSNQVNTNKSNSANSNTNTANSIGSSNKTNSANSNTTNINTTNSKNNSNLPNINNSTNTSIAANSSQGVPSADIISNSSSKNTSVIPNDNSKTFASVNPVHSNQAGTGATAASVGIAAQSASNNSSVNQNRKRSSEENNFNSSSNQNSSTRNSVSEENSNSNSTNQTLNNQFQKTSEPNEQSLLRKSGPTDKITEIIQPVLTPISTIDNNTLSASVISTTPAKQFSDSASMEPAPAPMPDSATMAKIKSRLSLDFFAGPQWSINNDALENGNSNSNQGGSGSGGSAGNSKFVKAASHSEINFGAQLNVHFKVVNLSFGMNYSMHKSVFSSVGNFSFDTITYNSPVSVNSQFSILEIPILAGHTFKPGRMNFEVNAGPSASFLTAVDSKVINESNSQVIYNVGSSSFKSMYWGINGSISIIYNLNEMFGIFVQPAVKYGLTNIVDNELFPEEKLQSYTLRGGLRLKF